MLRVRMPNIAEKCDTMHTPARTVAARQEGLHLCHAVWPVAKPMKTGYMGLRRISEKENCSGT